VAFYALILPLFAVGTYIVRARERGKALVHLLAGVGVVALIVSAVYFEGRMLASLGHEGEEELHMSHHGHGHKHRHHLERAEGGERSGEAKRKEADGDIAKLKAHTKGCTGPGKLRRYAQLPDFLERLEFIQEKLASNKRKALGFLLILLSDPETTEFYRDEAVTLLRKATGTDFGYLPEREPADNREALDKLCRHLQEVKRSEATLSEQQEEERKREIEQAVERESL
jgi:hypothetical protein